MGKIINEFHVKRIAKLLDTCGGKVVEGGQVNLESKYISPVIVLEPKMDSELMSEEIFGPILPIIPFSHIQ